MTTEGFSAFLFWSYAPGADLPEQVIIQHVASYGELEDLQRLREIFPKDVILKYLEKFNENPKRIYFLKEIILQNNEKTH